jgi:MraZ protein
MLLGEYEHTLDDKNRLTLPAKFREQFAGGIVLTRGIDGCLNAYTRGDWERLVESRLSTLDPLSKEGRMMQRHFFSAAAEAIPDRQGRVMVPASLIESGHLSRELVIAGVYDHLEIWDRAAWREQLRELEGRVEDAAERLAQRE